MDTLYTNPLATPQDLVAFRMEGDGVMSFPQGRLRLESLRPLSDGQAANVVLWCPEDFPEDVRVEWDFWPVREPGLAIMFFHARGRSGEDLFDPALAPRSGPYEQYHHGDIDAYHVSYFRRMWPQERALHTCNLRKSHGFHLVAQGPDPLPGVMDADGPYAMRIDVKGGVVTFSINDLVSFRWRDEGVIGGPALAGGKIGFRQMAPLIGEYANLRVSRH
ncbi:unnamed protein product [[Actinomadura] parvosata subsp. kistnae]|uniref:DUF1961 domain-containing protein n=1 Tax=[Actinomadura] parvosata subsp. kistnae TaxID=1909395 RepID=A0A1V0AJ92_9ACTN|nr:DUF1961 family protein [Nonomuraea sp. ATCC 55076]AQZ70162.1 hypothetical protein BKM31_05775 [Nonomuraea sp. ATCC 55076]SPL87577.1 unnamed protein product [Actinomadura parvosata subsp. kistnae]